MVDYGGAISLSQAHSSEDESSEHSPRSLPTLSSPATAAAVSSRQRATPNNRLSTVDHHHHHHHQIQSPASETTRKPRGRPPGSKNKPKPPIVITRDSDSAMKPVAIEISAGSDIIDWIINFARRNQVGISVMSASGSVSSVTLRHPVTHAPSLSLHGPFSLLNLYGSFLGSSKSSPSSSSPSSSSPPTSGSLSSLSSFGITLAGAQGQVFGGIVAGKIMAASRVIVVAATFMNPTFHRLPSHHEADHHDADNIQETNNKPPPNIGATEPCSSAGMSMTIYGVGSPAPLNCHISPDVVHWGTGPTSRPPY